MKPALIIGVFVLTALIAFSAVNFAAPGANASVISELESNAARIEAERAALEAQVAALDKQVSDLTSATGDETAELDEALVARGALQAQLDAAEEQLTAITAANATLTEEKSALMQEISVLSDQITSQESAILETEALNATVEEGRAEIAALQATIAELEQQQVAPSADAEGDARVAEAEAMLAEKTSALEAAEARIATLTDEATAQVEAVAEFAGQVESLDATIAALTADAANLSDEIAKRDEVITGLLSQTETSPTSAAVCQSETDTILAASTISFEPGSTQIADDSISALEALAVQASACIEQGLTLEIEGHTDTVGGVASNLLLSDGRAKAIRDFMVETGVQASSMRAVGFGGSDPVSEGAANERIVFDWEQN